MYFIHQDLIALKIEKKKNRNKEENKKRYSRTKFYPKYWKNTENFDDWFYLLKKIIFHW